MRMGHVLAITVVACVALSSNPALGGSMTWLRTTGAGDWGTASNWYGGKTPTAADTAILGNHGTINVNNAAATSVAASFHLARGTIVVTQNFTLSDPTAASYIGWSGTPASLTLGGGTFQIGNSNGTTPTAYFRVGEYQAATASFLQTGGVLSVGNLSNTGTKGFILGNSYATADGIANGTYEIQGGSASFKTLVQVGDASLANIGSGTFKVTGAAASPISIARYDSGPGFILSTAGTLAANFDSNGITPIHVTASAAANNAGDVQLDAGQIAVTNTLGTLTLNKVYTIMDWTGTNVGTGSPTVTTPGANWAVHVGSHAITAVDHGNINAVLNDLSLTPTNITGFDFANGYNTVNVSLTGAAPTTNQTWDVLMWTGAYTGNFVEGTLPSTPGAEWAWVDGPNSLQLSVTVPEPVTMSLLILGGIGALLRRRK